MRKEQLIQKMLLKMSEVQADPEYAKSMFDAVSKAVEDYREDGPEALAHACAAVAGVEAIRISTQTIFRVLLPVLNEFLEMLDEDGFDRLLKYDQ